jgi:peptidoglycan/xylan/chitin deacetylase (PgdA/CDA1 family)
MKTLLILPVLFFFAFLQSPREPSSALIVSILHGHARTAVDRILRSHGGIIRMDPTQKVIYLTFTAHEFAAGGAVVRATLQRHRVRASFFFTGDFYRATQHRTLIEDLLGDGHYLGAHSDRHLLYCAWENRDSLLVSRDQFLKDLEDNYAEMQRFGTRPASRLSISPPGPHPMLTTRRRT